MQLARRKKRKDDNVVKFSFQICLWQGDICAAAPPKICAFGGDIGSKDGANTKFLGVDVVQLQPG